MMSEQTYRGESVPRTSTDMVKEQVTKLKELFPETVTEGKVDFEKLRLILGDEVVESPERYNFTWAGKRNAIRLLQKQSRATLLPACNESVDFDETSNIFIEGDNLEVLKLLHKSYAGRIKLIYIDPPYNTGNDFVYPDNFADPLASYMRVTRQGDFEGPLSSNTESNGRYHSTWLSMMYPRLFLARQLLRDDGAIFVSIDDHEVHNLRMLMNEVFGEENFIANVVWQKKYTRSNDARWFSDNHDHILVYAYSREDFTLNLQPRTEEQKATYSNPDNHPKGPWKATPLHAKSGSTKGFRFTFKNGVTWSPPPGTYPRYSAETLARMDANDEIWFGRDGKATPSRKSFLSDVKVGVTPVTIWLHDEVGHNHEANNELKALLLEAVFDTPKPTKLVRRMLELVTAPSDDDIVLDFFAGSCTMAQAVLDLNHDDCGNRRFIMVQLPERTTNQDFLSIAEVGKERIRRAIGNIAKKSISELDLRQCPYREDLGFRVFKLAQSNYKSWIDSTQDTDAERYLTQLDLFTDPLVEGWMPENVIWEVALKEGYGLNARIEKITIPISNTVFLVKDTDKGQMFHICLDEDIRRETLEALRIGEENLFICLDTALTDELAANLALQCRLKTI